jgi:D-lyxose ketol-isomerase
MKRSDINALLEDGESYFDRMKFKLPPWAYWKTEDWQAYKTKAGEIIANRLGWDITDFGSGNYARRGLFLVTLRNGNPERDGKAYAEKAMIVDVDQETPMHFHWRKMEDIINRGGGELDLELYSSDSEGGLSSEPVRISVDGVEREFPPGGTLALGPGESVCLPPLVYHRFYARKSRCLVGEVSSVNDDSVDNRFLEPVGRFPAIEEDAEPRRLLVSDYPVRL